MPDWLLILIVKTETSPQPHLSPDHLLEEPHAYPTVQDAFAPEPTPKQTSSSPKPSRYLLFLRRVIAPLFRNFAKLLLMLMIRESFLCFMGYPGGRGLNSL